MYYVYVLKSDSTHKRYIGQTQNINKRISDHNNDESRYAKGRCPWKLVYSERYGTRTEAILREKYLKTGVGREFLDSLRS